MNKFEIIVLSSLIMIGCALLGIFFYHGGDVLNNLLPELIGITIEGIFLGILFTWIQRHEEKRSQEKTVNKLKIGTTCIAYDIYPMGNAC